MPIAFMAELHRSLSARSPSLAAFVKLFHLPRYASMYAPSCPEAIMASSSASASVASFSPVLMYSPMPRSDTARHTSSHASCRR